MKNILIHGLGQNAQNWNQISEYLNKNAITPLCPDLLSLLQNNEKDFTALYHSFCTYCLNQNEKLNLCGLSLGGVLSLEFVKQYPEKVNSLILIGTPYKIPKALFKLQGIIFHLMPKSVFYEMGCDKKSFISLVNSMGALKIHEGLDKITCDTLVLCGIKDKGNKKGAIALNEHIKNSRLEFIEKASHEVNIENLDKLAEIILAFWKTKQ